MPGKVTFGPYTLDFVEERLEKNGKPVHLTGQPQKILALLASRPGELVSREDLRDALWGEDTFVDFEQGLNTAVNRLRHALGDSAESPLFVETVPGRGYRLIAPVAEADVPSSASGAPLAEGPRSLLGSRILPWLLVVALGAGAATWMSLSRSPATGTSDAPVIRFPVVPPPGYWLEPAGTRQGFAVSPDGMEIALTTRGPSGGFSTWVRGLSEIDLRPVPMARNAHTLFWGADASQLFFALRGSLRSGQPSDDSFQVLSEQPDLILAGAVLASNEVLVMGNRQSSYLADLSGGDPVRLDTAFPWPTALPGGEHFLFLAYGDEQTSSVVKAARQDNFEIVADIVPSATRAEFAPSTEAASRGHLLFVRDGSLLAQPFDAARLQTLGQARVVASGVEHFAPAGAADFSVSQAGVLAYQPFAGRAEMTWTGLDGEAVSTVGDRDLGIQHLRLSPDGSRVAAELYDVEAGYAKLWIFDAQSGRGRPVSNEVAGGAVWAPDSRRLVYSGIGSPGLPQLYLRSVDEEGRGHPLSESFVPQVQVPTSWSPDGRFIAYQSQLEGDLWVAVIEEGVEPITHQIAVTRPFESAADFAPSGEWLAFLSDETGRPEVYVQAFRATDPPRLAGERIQVSDRGAVSFRWGRRGRELFVADAGGTLSVIPVDLEAREVGAPRTLFDIEIDATRPLTTLFTFDVSADGAHFLLPRLTRRESAHLVVLQNWQQLLRERDGPPARPADGSPRLPGRIDSDS